MPDPSVPPGQWWDAFSLRSEVALITGGGSGLGFGIASTFVKAGARVVLAGRRESVLVSAVKQLGAAASYEVCDITAHDEVSDLAARVAGRTGPVTILVNNAGNHLKKPIVDTTEQEFQSVLNTHVLGAYAITRAVVPSMLERRHGNILFMASMTALFGVPKVIAYSAAKSAYLGMVRSLACELSPQGVRVNALAPGWIETPMMLQALEDEPERKRRALSRTPMERFGCPEDIGWAAVYLCSPAAQFVTGVVLPVDGGASIGF